MILHVGTGKSIFTLVAVVYSFSLLWPKVLYPMMQESLFIHPGDLTTDSLSNYYLPTMMREAMGEARPLEYNQKRNPKMFLHPVRRTTFGHSRGSNAFGFIMPFYTIGIGIFFIYTIMRLSINKTPPNNKIHPETQLTLDCIRNRTINVQFQTVNILSTKISRLPKNRTKQFLEIYGKDKVKKALKTFILEMTKANDPSNQKYKTDIYLEQNYKTN